MITLLLLAVVCGGTYIRLFCAIFLGQPKEHKDFFKGALFLNQIILSFMKYEFLDMKNF